MAPSDRGFVQHEAIGSVEISGLLVAMEVADIMLKHANIRIKSVCNADAGIISVICTGDLAACKAAVDAGKAAGIRMKALLGSSLIGRPFEDTEALISVYAGSMFEIPVARTSKPAKTRKK